MEITKKVMILLFVFTFCCSNLIYPQSPSNEINDTNLSNDEEAIKKLLKDVILEYQTKHFENYSPLWVQEPYVMRIANNGSSYAGWDNLGEIYKSIMEENPDVKDNLSVELPEVHIKIYENTAWAFNIHTVKWTDEQGNEKEGNTWNLRFLEKKDGKWKIACYVDGPYKKVKDE